jgi:GPN-loop GTPase
LTYNLLNFTFKYILLSNVTDVLHYNCFSVSDPANDILPYEAAINITDLVTLDDTMVTFKLGPNGGLMYCMEFIEKNIDWLLERISKLKDHYFLLDFPGQV